MADVDAIAPVAAIEPRVTLQEWLPRLVLAPSFALILLFVYGFILFTGALSFSGSKLMPDLTTWVGLDNYARLFKHPNWLTALINLAIFATLYIIVCSVLGLGLAILLDQKIRGEGFLRPIYLYPMALSFIVTGVAWKWFLDPGIGLEHVDAATGAGRASPSAGSRTASSRSTPSSSPRSGSLPASSWRCFSPGCAASTTRSSRRRRSTAPRPSRSIAASSSR